jgi:hypothetical protein
MRLHYKILLIIISFYCLPGFAFAQQVLNIKGVVFKKSSLNRIAQALIADLNSKVVMMSDELGGFNIRVAIGDTLLITKNEYTPQKRMVINGDDLAIYMQPVIELNQVNIKEQSKKQELNEVMREYRSQGTFYNGNPPVLSFLNSPITGFYELFGKTPNEARRFAAFTKTELEYNEVHRRYTKELVKSVTKLPDDEAQKFMETFTPSFEDLKEWNDYQLIIYIKKSMAYYQKNKDKPQVKLQKLY